VGCCVDAGYDVYIGCHVCECLCVCALLKSTLVGTAGCGLLHGRRTYMSDTSSVTFAM
jgi:hypothetical protein